MKSITLEKVSGNKYISDITDFMNKYILLTFKSPVKTYLQTDKSGDGIFIKLSNDTVGYIEVVNDTIQSIILFLHGDYSLYSTELSSESISKRFTGYKVKKK